MATSKQVFALRKEGKIEEAYQMALTCILIDSEDEWNIKALAYCLYDKIKLAKESQDFATGQNLLQQLENLLDEFEDDVLLENLERARKMVNPERRIIDQAKELSRAGNHAEALRLYRESIVLFPDDINLNEQLGWELQKECKAVFEAGEVDVRKIRQLLSEYIRLKNPRPSNLHSTFLVYADKIINKPEFNLIAFLKLWGLENLRSEEFQPYSKDGVEYPALAEKIVQHAAKLILDQRISTEIDWLLPFLDKSIATFKKNIWLTYYKAKLLHLAKRSEEGIQFLIPVIKQKIADFWTWSLLGDLLVDSNKGKAISAYCRALQCKGEDKFLSNVHAKLCVLLRDAGFPNEARTEIETAIRIKTQEGVTIPENLVRYQKEDWYQNSSSNSHNKSFYHHNSRLIEEFVFESIPWQDANIGKSFTLPDKPNRIRVRIFYDGIISPFEFVISDNKFNITKRFKPGDSIKIKGEYGLEGKFQLYLLEKRESNEIFDVFEKHCGNILQVLKNADGVITGLRITAVNEKDSVKLTTSITDYTSHHESIFRVSKDEANERLSEGEPIYVKHYQKVLNGNIRRGPRNLMRLNFDPKIHIVAFEKRNDGLPFDCYPERVGRVSYVNSEKQTAFIVVKYGIGCQVKLTQLNGEVEITSKVAVRIKAVHKDGRSYYVALTCKLTDQKPAEKLLWNYAGEVKTDGTFGFVTHGHDDVYIPPELISFSQIKNGEKVTGRALLNYNSKKEIWGYRALDIAKVALDENK